MRKNKNKSSENYLERIPQRVEHLGWNTDADGKVTLEVENKGVFNRIAQKIFKKPRISYIHLDEMGSFVWPLIDGEKNITELGKSVEERFGEAAQPIYGRLAKYFQILDSYGFVTWKHNKD